MSYICKNCHDNGCAFCPMFQNLHEEQRLLVKKIEENCIEVAEPESLNKYSREIKPGVFVDVYDVIRAFEITDGAIAHAVKKLLAPGKRGHKSYLEDLNDVLVSVNRAIDSEIEWS